MPVTNPIIVVEGIKERAGNLGHDAELGEYGDVVERSILDPKEVAVGAAKKAGAKAA